MRWIAEYNITEQQNNIVLEHKSFQNESNRKSERIKMKQKKKKKQIQTNAFLWTVKVIHRLSWMESRWTGAGVVYYCIKEYLLRI